MGVLNSLEKDIFLNFAAAAEGEANDGVDDYHALDDDDDPDLDNEDGHYHDDDQAGGCGQPGKRLTIPSSFLTQVGEAF